MSEEEKAQIGELGRQIEAVIDEQEGPIPAETKEDVVATSVLDKAIAVEDDSREAPEPDAEAKSGFDEALLQRAQQMGFTPEQAQQFGEPALLEKALGQLDQRLMSLGAQAFQNIQQRQAQPAQQQPPQQQPPQQAPPPASAEPYKVELDPDLVDESVIKAIDGLNTYWQGQAQVLQNVITRVVGTIQNQQQTGVLNEFEGAIGDLDESYAGTFGKGTMQSLTPNGTEQLARAELLRDVVALRNGYEASGLAVPTIGEAVRRVAAGRFGEQAVQNAKQGARTELYEKTSRRAGQALERPTQRAAPRGSVASDDDIEKDVADFMRERGML